MTTTLVVFSHGKESGPWGSKITRLAAIAEAKGAEVLSIDYRDIPDDPDARVARLVATPLPPHERLLLVGSSMGGYVACVASQQLDTAGLFLMAPALALPGFGRAAAVSPCRAIEVVFGWRDNVVPLTPVRHFAEIHRASLHCLDADHRLDEVLDTVAELFAAFLDRLSKGCSAVA